MKKFFMIMIGMLLSAIGFAQNKSFQSVDNDAFAKLITQPNVIILDVRTPAEYKTGHIANAQNIDLKASDFNDRTSKLDKSKTIAIYCRTGARSKIAAKKLSDKGYKIVELDRGIANWNGPVQK